MGRWLLFVAACFVLAVPTLAPAETFEVQVKDFTFAPQDLSIQKGDTVRWVWVEGAHTTTSGEPDDTENIGLVWSSPMTSESLTFEFTFNDAGTFLYFCQVHPATMRATVTVETETPVEVTTWGKIKRLFQDTSPGRGL